MAAFRVLPSTALPCKNSWLVSGPPWAGQVIADLTANRGRALVHAGPDQPPETHALVHAINEKLGARGNTLELITPVAYPEDQAAPLADLVEDMRTGKVSTLLIMDSNPAYATPGALGFAEALQRVDFSLTLTVSPNETSQLTTWAVPMAHPWETWSDGRAFDGTATILQPQALPLYNGIDMHTMLALFTEPAPAATLGTVQATWKTRMGEDFAQGWSDALASGVVPGTASPKANVTLRRDAGRQTPPEPANHPLTILFRPDPHLWDGRYASQGELVRRSIRAHLGIVPPGLALAAALAQNEGRSAPQVNGGTAHDAPLDSRATAIFPAVSGGVASSVQGEGPAEWLIQCAGSRLRHIVGKAAPANLTAISSSRSVRWNVSLRRRPSCMM
jgi:hypothetical protein